MSRAVAKRQVGVSNPGTPSTGIIIGLVLIGLLIYLVVKRNQSAQQPNGQYLNEEKWDVAYNDDGLPTSITIHRNATRR